MGESSWRPLSSSVGSQMVPQCLSDAAPPKQPLTAPLLPYICVGRKWKEAEGFMWLVGFSFLGAVGGA